MKVDLLSPEDDRWVRFLSGIEHQFYQSPGYVKLEAERMKGDPRALFVEDAGCALLIPLVLVSSTVGSNGPEVLDALSPYGYPGFLIQCPEDGAAFLRGALEGARPVLQEAGISGVFVRLDPLASIEASLPDVGILVEHGSCTWIDLTLPEEELDRQLRPRYRSYIRAMRRDGVTARFDESFQELDAFVDLYYRTMDAVGAARMYYFGRSYFEGLKDVLGDCLKLCLVEYRQRIVAAGLFSDTGGVVQYLFSGKDAEAGHPHSTKLMMVHVRDWARIQGRRAMNLGGGVGGRSGDSLSHFKRGFSKLSKPFFSWRWIVDENRFRLALQAWERLAGKQADGLEGFFPPYRKPIEGVSPVQRSGRLSVQG